MLMFSELWNDNTMSVEGGDMGYGMEWKQRHIIDEVYLVSSGQPSG